MTTKNNLNLCVPELGYKKPYEDKKIRIQKTIFDRIRLILQFVVMLFGLILIFRLIDYVYYATKAMGGSGFTPTFGSVSPRNIGGSGKFDCQKATDFKNVAYYGKSDTFLQIISDMTKIIIETPNLSDEDINTKFKATSRNYLFSGVPGTGKTQFVKSLIYKLNRNLVAKFEEDEDTSLLGAFFISPSNLMATYYGETENNIRLLFEQARNSKYKAIILFIDEVESFFSARTHNLHTIDLGIKSEFLNLMSGISEDLRSNVFLIGATNLVEQIDPAFKRRLGKHFIFKIPDKYEIKVILDQITKNWPKTFESERLLNECVDILKREGATQAIITDITANLMFACGEDNPDLISVLHGALSLLEENNGHINITNINFETSGAKNEYIFVKDL